jgi:hypothetical protein
MRPALNSEAFFETVFGLSRMGKCGPEGIPTGSLQLAVLLDTYGDVFRPLKIPTPIRYAMVKGLAPVTRILGYRATFPEFSQPWEVPET